MTAQLSFFPVGNGDMTLVQREGGNRILIEINIWSAADDPDDGTPDVVSKLRNKLKRDASGRLYIDALLISRADKWKRRFLQCRCTRGGRGRTQVRP